MMSLAEIWAAEDVETVRHCRYPMTDDQPHYFCAEPTDGRSYCPAHDAKCHAGQGKPWQALAGMMANVEQTIVPAGAAYDKAGDVDEVLQEAAEYFDKPGGLMGRT